MRCKLISGYDGFYKISDTGRIWTCRRTGRKKNVKTAWREMQSQPHVYSGHPLIGLSKDGKTIKKSVHQLVLITFVGPCPDGMECRHIDGKPDNNRLDNLEWATYKVNQNDRAKHGTSNRGERCATSKLKTNQVLKIRELYNTDEWTMRRLADTYGVSSITIFDIVKGRTWRHV